jgi:hypothetical protein
MPPAAGFLCEQYRPTSDKTIIARGSRQAVKQSVLSLDFCGESLRLAPQLIEVRLHTGGLEEKGPPVAANAACLFVWLDNGSGEESAYAPIQAQRSHLQGSCDRTPECSDGRRHELKGHLQPGAFLRHLQER